MVIISGSNSFIGQNLLSTISNSNGISLRSPDWQETLLSAKVIINLVGKAHDHNGTATKNDFYYANVELAKEVYKGFIASDAKLLIHISSIAAIEEFEALTPLTETCEHCPISWYGESKLEAEDWLLSASLPKNKKLIILRPPMVHGLGDKGNLGLLYKLITKGIPYPLASFDNKRSFISIDNFCYFIEQIIAKQDQMESGIYHIADDESVSTGDIIKIIKKITGRRVIDLSLPKWLVKGIAKIGDKLSIPLNTKRLKKMTSTLLVSNQKIKTALGITQLPLTAEAGLEKTIRSFGQYPKPARNEES